MKNETLSVKSKRRTFILVFFVALFLISFSGSVLAAGSATVSWTPPTTDQGGGALTGLAGYKIYYDTASHWTAGCNLALGTSLDVSGGSVNSYRFDNNLTPGQTYYFTVVAYDEENPANVSGCASDGTDTEVSKIVSYTADINTSATSNHKVDLLDFNTFRSNWGSTDCNNVANFVGRTSGCAVNLLDFNVLRADFGQSF